MNIKTATLRRELAEIIQRVYAQKSRAVIHRYGVPVAVVMSKDEADELDRLRMLYTPSAHAGRPAA